MDDKQPRRWRRTFAGRDRDGDRTERWRRYWNWNWNWKVVVGVNEAISNLSINQSGEEMCHVWEWNCESRKDRIWYLVTVKL